MTAARRIWQRLGRRARPGAGVAIWPAVLAVATAAVVVVATAFAAAVAVYAARDDREAARTPVVAEDADRAELLWRDSHDSVGLRDATVVSLVPLHAGAPLPPGVAAWPAAGEAVLSPALVAAGADEGIGSRYGRTVGLISEDGLASPAELLAYVRPSDAAVLDADGMLPVSRFGEPVAYGLIGEAAEVQPLRNLLALMAVTLAVPALLLLGVAVRASQVERQRQAVLLHVLGARRGERWSWAWGAVARPVTAGLTVASAVLAAALTRDWALPGRGYVVAAADMRHSAGTLLLTAVVAGLLVVVVAIDAARPRLAAATRPRPVGARWPAWRALTCLVAAPVAVVAALVVRQGGSVAALLVYLVAVVVTISQLPALVGYLVARLGGALRENGSLRSSPDRLVAGAGLAHDARAVVRSAGLIAVAMVLVTQAQSYLALTSDTVREAEAVRAAVDGRFVSVLNPPGTERSWPQVDSVVRSGLGLDAVWLVESVDDDGAVSTAVHGTPDSLASLGIGGDVTTVDLESVPGRAGVALRYTSGSDVVAVEMSGVADWIDDSASSGHQVSALVFAPDLSRIDLPALKAAVYDVATPAWRVEHPGDVWLLGNLLGRHQAGWVGWFGAVGITLLAVGACGAAADDVRRSAARLAPLASLYARPGTTRRVVAWRLGVPLGVAVACGAVISLMLGSVLRVGTGTTVDLLPLLISISASVALAGAGVWGAAVFSIRRTSRRWDGRGVPA